MKQDEIKEYFTNPLLYQQYNAGFYSPEELKDFGFKSLGENVLISRLAQIYAPHKIAIGSNVRIDDFAILSGAITLGSFIHISSHSNITGGDGISASVSMGDFCSLSLGSRILSLSDDLSGEVLINSCIPSQYRHIIASHIHLPKHNHIAAMSLVLPQTTFEEGANLGPNSLAGGITLKSYGYYFGSPARLLKLLDSEAIKMREAQFLAQYEQDCKKQRGGGISRTFLSHTHYKIYITLPQYKATSTFCSATKESQLLSHFKHCKESLSDLLATPLACHVFSLGSKAEELLLSAKDFSKESLENLLSCHHEPFLEGEESLLDLLENPLVCHSERSEESLQESLVAKRDSSPLAGVQNDKLCYPQG
ncbi:acyltransferase, partial [Helicobacter marmotae]